jgi:hypothetical protein
MNDWLRLSGIKESKETGFEQFAGKRYEGAEKIADAAAEKGGPALLTRDHFKIKLPYYSKAKNGDFNASKAKKEYSELCSKLQSKDVESMEMKQFQELLGKIEVLGELIIESKLKS